MGSVGWNVDISYLGNDKPRRSPHGERGLEYKGRGTLSLLSIVAPRMGSVGWNSCSHLNIASQQVAPRMGSVGWNRAIREECGFSQRRSPHGERGLEWERYRCCSPQVPVAPRMGSVGWNFSLGIWRSFSSSRSPHGERGLE